MSSDDYKPRNPFARNTKPANGTEKPKKKIKTFSNPFDSTSHSLHHEGSGVKMSDIISGKYEDEISDDLSIPYFGQDTEQADLVEHNTTKGSRTIFKKGTKKEASFDYSRGGMSFKPEILNNPMADMALNQGKK
jgi:hypothetical protein